VSASTIRVFLAEIRIAVAGAMNHEIGVFLLQQCAEPVGIPDVRGPVALGRMAMPDPHDLAGLGEAPAHGAAQESRPAGDQGFHAGRVRKAAEADKREGRMNDREHPDRG
jgi:hypothetical protein